MDLDDKDLVIALRMMPGGDLAHHLKVRINSVAVCGSAALLGWRICGVLRHPATQVAKRRCEKEERPRTGETESSHPINPGGPPSLG